MLTGTLDPGADQAARVQRRLERERSARLAAEAIAEESLRNLYAKQKDLDLLRSITAAANESSAVEEALQAAIDQVCEYAGWPVGHVYVRHEDPTRGLAPTPIWHLEPPERFELFRRVTEATPLPLGVGLPGRVAAAGRAAWIVDVTLDGNFPRAVVAGDIGVRAAFGFPVLVGCEVAAVLEFFAETAIEPNDRFLEITTSIGAQLGRVIERQRAAVALRNSNQQLTEALAQVERTQQQIVQQERLRALGQMASGIAHDFNNALMAMVGFSDLLLTDRASRDDPRRLLHFLNLIHTSAKDAAAIVGRMTEFYRQRSERPTEGVDLNALVRTAAALTEPKWKLQAQARGATIRLETALAPLPSVAGHPAELREALINLIFNAVDAMPSGGTLWIRTSIQDGPPAVLMQVADTGTGMTAEVRQRCLEPFFSTKGERGTGLGLSMVYGVVERHRGTIDIETEPGRGTTFTIRLPLPPLTAAPTSAGDGQPTPRPLRVLVVDDEPIPRHVIAECLAVDGHAVESAADGREALEHVRAGTFDLVVTDRAMPNLNGDELAAAVKRLAPGTPVLMVTGFGDLMATTGDVPRDVDLVVGKPITLDKLRRAVAGVVPAPLA